ncbi:MAG: GGDEF domain-containing protein [Vicinamibacterales bacterium]
MPSSKPLSPFAERLNALVDKWSARLPWEWHQQFVDDFLPLGKEHEETLEIIETIWRREQRAYAFDESTGLARRRPFQVHLTRLLSGADLPTTTAVAVLFIDLNNLKRINDTCGHAAGDQALSAVGRILREALRVDRQTDVVMKAEAMDDYSIARHGGDEFLVALELSDAADIEAIAPRLKRRIEDPEHQRARGYHAPIRLTTAIGGVVYELPYSRPTMAATALAKELVRLADEQMYESKDDGLIHVAAVQFTDRLEVAPERARVLL